MKKFGRKLISYLSLFIMIFGFFLPNFTYIVNATEGDNNITLTTDYEKLSNIIFLSSDQYIDISEIADVDENTLFNVDDEEIFTVSEDGIVHTLNSGYSVLTVRNHSYDSYYVIAVDYEKEVFIESLIANLQLDLKINYSMLDSFSEKEAVIRTGKEFIRDYLKIDDRNVFNFTYSEGVDEDVITLGICFEDLCSSPKYVIYEFYGIYSDDELIEVNVGETKRANISFTEGHLSNLRFTTLHNDVAIADSKGNVTGLKPGKTWLRIYDKYMKHYYHVPIWVDKELYVQESKEYLNDTVFKVDVGKFTNEIWDSEIVSEVLYQMSNAGVSLNDVFDYNTYATSVNEEEGTVTFVFDEDGNKTFIVSFELDGVFLHDRSIGKIAVGEEVVPPFTAINSGTRLESSDENICTIEEISVIGVSPGICSVTFILGEYENHRTFIIGEKEIKESLNHLLESVPDTLDLKMDPYDSSLVFEEEFSYSNQLVGVIQSYYKNNLQLPDGISFATLNYDYYSETSTFDIRLVYNDDAYDGNGYYSNNELVLSDNKTISINYLGHSEDWQEIGQEIKSNVKSNYSLSFEQMLMYKIFAPFESNIIYYSDFYTDFFDACSDCDFVDVGGAGGTFAPGALYSASIFVVLKDGEPVTDIYVDATGIFTLDFYDIKDSDQIEKEFKKQLHDAYKKMVQFTPVYSPFNRVKTNSDSIDNFMYEYDIELDYRESYGNVISYDVSLDGHEFIANLQVNVTDNSNDYTVKVDEISLSDNELTLTVGDKKNISFEVAPDYADDKTVKWISGDESVVKVVNGEITAVGPGETTITVESNDGNTKSIINVKVKPILVGSIKLNKEVLNLEVDDTFDLIATITPDNATNKNVKWSSSDEKVVTVIDGKVTALCSGNAIITVESEDGNAKATINVSVIDPKVAGDVDGDGKVNIVDLVQIRKHLAGIITLKGDPYEGADVNKDGTVNILDLVKIRKHLAGLEVIK